MVFECECMLETSLRGWYFLCRISFSVHSD